MPQGDVKGVGHESDEDVRLNPFLVLMMDRPKSQVSFQVLECLFDVNQLSIELPHLGGVAANEVRSEEISPLTASGLSQFFFAQREPEGCIPFGDSDLNKPPCLLSLIALVKAFRHCLGSRLIHEAS